MAELLVGAARCDNAMREPLCFACVILCMLVVEEHVVSVACVIILIIIVIIIVISQTGHKPGQPGILRDFSEHGKLGEFSGNSMQPQGKM